MDDKWQLGGCRDAGFAHVLVCEVAPTLHVFESGCVVVARGGSVSWRGRMCQCVLSRVVSVACVSYALAVGVMVPGGSSCNDRATTPGLRVGCKCWRWCCGVGGSRRGCRFEVWGGGFGVGGYADVVVVVNCIGAGPLSVARRVWVGTADCRAGVSVALSDA